MTARKVVRTVALLVTSAAIAVGIWYLACPKPAPPGHPVPAITVPVPLAEGGTGDESTGTTSGSSGDSTGPEASTGPGPIG